MDTNSTQNILLIIGGFILIGLFIILSGIEILSKHIKDKDLKQFLERAQIALIVIILVSIFAVPIILGPGPHH